MIFYDRGRQVTVTIVGEDTSKLEIRIQNFLVNQCRLARVDVRSTFTKTPYWNLALQAGAMIGFAGIGAFLFISYTIPPQFQDRVPVGLFLGGLLPFMFLLIFGMMANNESRSRKESREDDINRELYKN